MTRKAKHKLVDIKSGRKKSNDELRCVIKKKSCRVCLQGLVWFCRIDHVKAAKCLKTNYAVTNGELVIPAKFKNEIVALPKKTDFQENFETHYTKNYSF